jgi:hypothetical protein
VAQFRSTHDLSSGDPAALTWCNACGPPVRSFQTGGRRTTFGAPLPVRNSSLEKGLLLSSTRACKPTMPCVQACHVYAGIRPECGCPCMHAVCRRGPGSIADHLRRGGEAAA